MNRILETVHGFEKRLSETFAGEIRTTPCGNSIDTQWSLMMRRARKALRPSGVARESGNISHFRKHGRTRWGFPLSMQVQTQSLCNGKCTICPYPVVKEKNDQGQMDERLCDRISYFKQRNSR